MKKLTRHYRKLHASYIKTMLVVLFLSLFTLPSYVKFEPDGENMFHVFLNGKEIYLQPREFRLLLHFARNPGIVVTPDRICETIWPNSYDQNRDVSAVIAELRRKLGDSKDHPDYIATVHGFGYRFLPLV